MRIARCRREQTLPNGEIWRNIVTEEKSVVAHSLDEFRGNYRYNWLDETFSRLPRRGADVRAMGRSRGGRRLVAGRHRGREPATMPMAARVWWHRRAAPSTNSCRCALMPERDGRVYRKIALWTAARRLHDRHALLPRLELEQAGRSATMPSSSARSQLAWLKRELVASDATWKVIAADLPIGLVSLDAVALGDGPPARREHEIADLLSFMKRAGVRNTVWLTADMHYTAAHHYDPNRAVFQDFEPFWEFVSGPLHAGTWSPGELDNTFGPKAMYQKGCSAEQGDNLAPCFGLQFFGRVDIDGKTGVMTVTLKDVDNHDLWSVDIEPRPDARAGQIMAEHI